MVSIDMTGDGCISVLTQTIINEEIDNHRELLEPGQFIRAGEILPADQYNAVAAIWTEEVIAAYREKIEAAEAVIGE